MLAGIQVELHVLPVPPSDQTHAVKINCVSGRAVVYDYVMWWTRCGSAVFLYQVASSMEKKVIGSVGVLNSGELGK